LFVFIFRFTQLVISDNLVNVTLKVLMRKNAYLLI